MEDNQNYFNKQNLSEIADISRCFSAKKNIEEKFFISLEKINLLLNTPQKADNVLEFVLDSLEPVFNYDKAMVLFLDGDNLTLKASKYLDNIADKDFKSGIFEDDSGISKIIRAKKPIIENSLTGKDSTLYKLGLKINKLFSTLITPLIIRETLFGIIILIKEIPDYFDKEDAKIAETFANAAAYSIKDAELSHVFKMQLRILKENITERTKALETIKEQNLKILEADQVKNEFLANMSHELRTPLNAIIGFSEALKLGIFGELNDKQGEYIGDIHASGIHLLGMINDLLDLSKIEARKMQLYKQAISVYSNVKEVINVVNALASKKKIAIQVLSDENCLKINADQRKFQQIMYNLLSNAIKFTDENGNIDVNIEKEDNNIKISVQDNGIGIDPQYHEKIFAKFQQVDNSYSRKQGSTGLGLTITKELVEMHGGKIWVESKIGAGAKFIFTMPLKG